MRLLADTHLLIWAANNPKRLSRSAIAILDNPANIVLFSTISVAEVAIKFSLRRPDFPVDPRELRTSLLANGYEELPMTGSHAERVADLPPLHKDPFDRMLVAQAMAEGVPLLTADAALADYGAMVRVVK